MLDLNTCYWSPGNDGHSCCTHPYYCIFNQNRIQLESDITTLENELHKRIDDLKFIKHEGTSNTKDYNETKSRIKYLNRDLEQLRNFRKKIIKKEVKAYGYMGIQ